MIGYLRGTVLFRDEDYIVIDAGGIGLEVSLTDQALDGLPEVGETAQLFTHLIVRDDGFYLFGFASREERSMFELLMTVSGVGPKNAITILSQLGEDGFVQALAAGNELPFTKVKGVGKKTAERIVVDLKDKVAKVFKGTTIVSGGVPVRLSGNLLEVESALTSLGFKKTEILSALQGLRDRKDDPVEDLIREALRRVTP